MVTKPVCYHMKAPCLGKEGNRLLSTFVWSVQVPSLSVRPVCVFNYHLLKGLGKHIYRGILSKKNRYFLCDSAEISQSA